MEFNRDNRVLTGRLLILAGIIYPAWSILAQSIQAWEYNDILPRIGVALVPIFFGIFREKFKNHFTFAVHFSLTLFMVQFAFFTGASGGHERYLFGSLVLALGTFIGFLSYPKEFLIHAGVSGLSFIVFPWYFGVLEKVFPMVRQIIMFYIVMYIITRLTKSHALVIEKLRAERIQLLDEHKTMITENLKNAQSVFSSLAATQEDLPENLILKSYYRPAHDAGGDWLGHFYLKEKNWLILTIGDVTGHDLASSLVTIAVAGAARGTFESISGSVTDLESLLKQMALSSNLAVKYCGIKQKTMSAAFFGVDLNTFKAVYINCAHPSGLWQSSSEIVPLDNEPGAFLGADNFSLAISHLKLSGLKAIFLYTDGLVENPGHPLTEARLARRMSRSDNFYSELSQEMDNVTLQDDVSFLILEMKS